MLTLNECKEILKNEAEGLTDDQILSIRDWLSIMAEIAIESFERTIHVKNK